MTENNFFLILLTLILMSYLSLIFVMQPLLMGLLIISQSMMFSIMISLLFKFSWFSFIIFIVYLGGILMLFSYVISMEFMPEFKSKELLMKMKFIFSVSLLILSQSFKEDKLKEFLVYEKLDVKTILSNLFSNSYSLSVFLLIFLLLVMIVVVFLIENSKGSMRTI